MWILYSFLAAIFHALDSATSKKALQKEAVLNFIGAGTHIMADLFLGLFLLIKTGHVFPQISNIPHFWQAVLATALLEATTMFFQYRAMALADFSYLMPFFSLTAIITVIPSFLAFREWPSPIGFLGIVVIVSGAIIMNYKNKKKTIIQDIETIN